MSQLTRAQAKTTKRAIDLDMGRIEDLVARMRHRVTDHALTGDRQLEELRDLAEQLKAIVDRRTDV